MRLRSEADVQQFLDAVNQCGGDVYLKSPEGDIFNLKSSMSRYIAIGRLIEEQGDTLELFADRKEDQARLMPLVEDLMKTEDGAPAKPARPEPSGRAFSVQDSHLSKDGFTKYRFFSFILSLASRRPSPKRWKWTISRARRNLMTSFTSGSSLRRRMLS